MALNKPKLIQDIFDLLEEMIETTNADAAQLAFATKLASAIDNYIKTATVTTTVTGACATPAGAGTITGSGTGKLS